jgi:hypothetical protein
MTDLAHFARAVDSLRRVPLTAAEEALADDAMLSLSKLRDALVGRNANLLACRIDEALERVEDACRGRV